MHGRRQSREERGRGTERSCLTKCRSRGRKGAEATEVQVCTGSSIGDASSSRRHFRRCRSRSAWEVIELLTMLQKSTRDPHLDLLLTAVRRQPC